MYQCPICDNELSPPHIDTINGMICEESQYCHDCGYYYDFSYGSYHEGIEGVEEFVWSYTTKKDDPSFLEWQQKITDFRKRRVKNGCLENSQNDQQNNNNAF